MLASLINSTVDEAADFYRKLPLFGEKHDYKVPAWADVLYEKGMRVGGTSKALDDGLRAAARVRYVNTFHYTCPTEMPEDEADRREAWLGNALLRVIKIMLYWKLQRDGIVNLEDSISTK